ncbi:MAG: hypothetical protein KU37_05195 [Sulfuricurvum sp. PC08-66]|nr:MAG: hypothetical protein KU37_05195 [Sulfuricurvum sp. PC08-66]
MRNLGKLLFFAFWVTQTLWGAFEVQVNATRIHQGDQLAISFVSNYNDNFPALADIAGLAIQSQSRSASTSIINGRRTAQYLLRVIVTPVQSFTIPSFTMREGDKNVESKPIAIEVIPRTQDANSDLFFDMKASARTLYVGEPFVVTLTYRQAQGLEVIDARLSPPQGQHLWVDTQNVKKRTAQTSTHDVQMMDYLFTPQKAGNLTINPAHIQVGLRSYGRDAWGMISMMPQYKSLFASPITIEVLPLPKGAQTIGEFSLRATVDKTQSSDKEPINLTITIEGSGNVEDIAPYTLAIEDVLIYDEAPTRDFALKGDAYVGKFEQKFALIGDANYTIPAVKFSYFDKKQKKVVTLQSKPIDIAITSTKRVAATASTPLVVERAQEGVEPTTSQEAQGFAWYEAVVIFVLGIAAGVGAMLLPWSRWLHRQPKAPKPKAIAPHEYKRALQHLMPHATHDAEARAMVEALSQKIYGDGAVIIDEKALKALLKRLS